MPLATCPPPTNLERLFLGGLPEPDADALEQHVLECDTCLEQLKKLFHARETLAGVLRDDTPSDAVAARPVVADLMTKLKSLRPAPASGQVADVSAQVAAAPFSEEDMRTLPRSATPSPSGQGSETEQPSDRPDATAEGEAPDPGHDANFIAFLAPPQADDELGRLGRYRILKVLGHGGMGVVFQAEDFELKRRIALKAMLPHLAASIKAYQRFRREALAMAVLKHDHIATIYEVNEERGIPFLAMEFLVGESLDERLKREKVLPPDEVLRIGREIAEALQAAHASGLIHRDIKPSNIWLETPRNRVKILDFGLAKQLDVGVGQTTPGVILGTPAFMAPEQARGELVDARCDLFSLGVVLYCLCTGRLPFQGRDVPSMLLAIATHKPAPPIRLNADVPRELSDLVMRLLEKDPARRPASAEAVVQVLLTLETKRARPSPGPPPAAAAYRDAAAAGRPRRRGDVGADPHYDRSGRLRHPNRRSGFLLPGRQGGRHPAGPQEQPRVQPEGAAPGSGLRGARAGSDRRRRRPLVQYEDLHHQARRTGCPQGLVRAQASGGRQPNTGNRR